MLTDEERSEVYGQISAAVASKQATREAMLRNLRRQGLTEKQAAQRLGVAVKPLDKHNTRLATRAAKALASITDQRRSKITSVPTGLPLKTTKKPPHSVFPKMVVDPSEEETVLMGGENNAKMGGVVLVGWLKGARIVSLTLEERKTCPTSCVVWDACYLNNMQRQKRFRHGPALLVKIDRELDVLCARGKVLVRLHIGGDFYSLVYLRFWASQIENRPNLHVFGFTAWLPGTEIGDEVIRLRTVMPDRFAVRTSTNIRGTFEEWEAYVLDRPTFLTRIGGATVCPEQHDALTGNKKRIHCGSCGLCWSNSVPIIFNGH